MQGGANSNFGRRCVSPCDQDRGCHVADPTSCSIYQMSSGRLMQQHLEAGDSRLRLQHIQSCGVCQPGKRSQNQLDVPPMPCMVA